MRKVLSALAALLLLAGCGDPEAVPAAGAKKAAVVFAAVSLTDVLEDLGDQYAAAGHLKPRFNFAASSALAKQIEQGAEADLFISADEDWMDYLQNRKLIDPATRISLLANELVLVAPANAPFSMEIVPRMDLASALKGGKLALADPASVPAGKYARQSLEHFGAWAAVEPMIVRTENVRSALRFVETGDAAGGIVYATDAMAAGSSVMVVGTFPSNSHTPITYPVAALATKADGPGRAFLDFLTSDPARRTFEAAGFRSPP